MGGDLNLYEACGCGIASLRVRCIGRTDDMLIVRGVNVFPSAIREVVARFEPRVSGAVMVRPRRRGVRQDPPLPSWWKLPTPSWRARSAPKFAPRLR